MSLKVSSTRICSEHKSETSMQDGAIHEKSPDSAQDCGHITESEGRSTDMTDKATSGKPWGGLGELQDVNKKPVTKRGSKRPAQSDEKVCKDLKKEQVRQDTHGTSTVPSQSICPDSTSNNDVVMTGTLIPVYLPKGSTTNSANDLLLSASNLINSDVPAISSQRSETFAIPMGNRSIPIFHNASQSRGTVVVSYVDNQPVIRNLFVGSGSQTSDSPPNVEAVPAHQTDIRLVGPPYASQSDNVIADDSIDTDSITHNSCMKDSLLTSGSVHPALKAFMHLNGITNWQNFPTRSFILPITNANNSVKGTQDTMLTPSDVNNAPETALSSSSVGQTSTDGTNVINAFIKNHSELMNTYKHLMAPLYLLDYSLPANLNHPSTLTHVPNMTDSDYFQNSLRADEHCPKSTADSSNADKLITVSDFIDQHYAVEDGSHVDVLESKSNTGNSSDCMEPLDLSIKKFKYK